MTEPGVTAPTSPSGSATPVPASSVEPEPDEWRRRWPPMGYWVRVALTIAAVAAALWVLWSVFNIVVLIVMAAVLAIGLDPAVRFFERRGESRGRAVAVISLSVTALVILFAWLVIPRVVTQIGGLADDIPTYIERLEARDDAIGRYVRENDVSKRLEDFVADLPEKITGSFGTIVGVAGRVGTALFSLITVAILTIYFMASLPRMRRTAAIVFAPSTRERAEDVIEKAIDRIGGYVGGILVTASIAGISALLFFSILGVLGIGIPFAFPLAVFAALMGLIPAVGAYIGAAPAVAVGFFQRPLTGILILAYFIVYQQIENYAIQPRIMKDAVNLSPAAAVISVLVFGSLGGFAGSLLALPAAATIKVIFVEVFLRDRVAEGDVEAKEKLEEHERAEEEAEHEAQQRARSRQRIARRIRDLFTGKDEG
ncbi:MAG TPA: AI-2E family transporter [Actinomycetota bacterium]|nr:AI-2E family transporter [Actinomycetota bacterium]